MVSNESMLENYSGLHISSLNHILSYIIIYTLLPVSEVVKVKRIWERDIVK